MRLLRILDGPGSERLVCVVDAFEPEAVPCWFAGRGYPLDTVFPLEYEGDHASIHQVAMFACVPPGELPVAAPVACARQARVNRD